MEWVAISSPGHLPDTGIGSGSPALWVDSLPTEPPGNERNANQNYNEVSPHTDQNGYHRNIYKQKILETMWRKGNPPALLVGMFNHYGEQCGDSFKN